ncbi:hypothetical protein [Bradyrhizobium sp. BR 10289]|uniref:hypothetical protein n=1 Tax=Bradyrhizobium sp. BR 10289 TaxID=2749993 RepID=UPI001C648A18|nr:hypothetical protein [Bradyrhizobium sp. BR 10289]MBW7967938.1 hypothetical protein [Bradyrhizobium sp. BR 10289]
MRTPSPDLAGRFRSIVARLGAAFHAQRKMEAQRALQRYRHLLEQPHDALPLNEIIPVSNKEDISAHAHGLDARERAPGEPAFERA